MSNKTKVSQVRNAQCVDVLIEKFNHDFVYNSKSVVLHLTRTIRSEIKSPPHTPSFRLRRSKDDAYYAQITVYTDILKCKIAINLNFSGLLC